MNPTGFVLPAASIGLSALLVRPRRGFFPQDTGTFVGPLRPIVAQITVSEQHSDQMEITEHPVEQGAPIADHAFKRPATVVITAMWSNSPTRPGSLVSAAVGIGSALSPVIRAASGVEQFGNAAQSILIGSSENQVRQVYQDLLQLQSSRVRCDVYTGKRTYKDMLLKTLRLDTDADTENALAIVMEWQQVIIVTTQTITVNNNPATQLEPQSTAPVVPQGTKSLTSPTGYTPQTFSLTGALTDTEAGFGSINRLLKENISYVEAEGGPISRLDQVLDRSMQQIESVVESLPQPFSLPLTTGAQSFTVSLQGFNVEGLVGQAMRELPAQLQVAKDALVATEQQVPFIASGMPTSMANIVDQIRASIESATNSQRQLERAI